MSGTAISATEFLESSNATPACRVVDVRTPEEFAGSRLPGSENIPLDALNEETCRQLNSCGPLYLLCGMGMRAEKARALLAQQGDCCAQVIEGGIAALENCGASLERDGN